MFVGVMLLMLVCGMHISSFVCVAYVCVDVCVVYLSTRNPEPIFIYAGIVFTHDGPAFDSSSPARL